MRVLLIDGLNLVRRIFAGVPGDPDSREHTEAVVNSVRGSVQRALNELEPSHCVCVFDGAEPSWRHALYADYKRARAPMPQALASGVNDIKAAIQATDVACFSLPDYEADDVIATIARRVAAHGGQSVVLSTDTSFCQLLGPGIRIRDHFAGRDLDEAYVIEKFAVRPHQLADYLALVGNPSLSISGVKGIGAKTATRLLGEYESLEGLLANVDAVPGRAGKQLTDATDEARLAYRLVRLRSDVKLGMNLNQFRWTSPTSE